MWQAETLYASVAFQAHTMPERKNDRQEKATLLGATILHHACMSGVPAGMLVLLLPSQVSSLHTYFVLVELTSNLPFA